MHKALIVEDNPEHVALLQPILEELNFTVEVASDGNTGLSKALNQSYQLVVLDLTLPGVSGIEICKDIKAHTPDVGIIVVSARDDEVSTVLLLEMGADDYVTKPFRPSEMRARVRSLLRRIDGFTGPRKQFKTGEILIDFEFRKVFRNDAEVDLTAREFDLIELLCSKPGKPFRRAEILNYLYGQEVTGYDHSITSHVNRIRSKLEVDPDNPKYLLTLRGVGYSFAAGD